MLRVLSFLVAQLRARNSTPFPSTTLFRSIRLSQGVTVQPALKVAVAQGAVRRLLVGDPHVQRFEVLADQQPAHGALGHRQDRKSTRLNSSHPSISYAVFCLKKKVLIQSVF